MTPVRQRPQVSDTGLSDRSRRYSLVLGREREIDRVLSSADGATGIRTIIRQPAASEPAGSYTLRTDERGWNKVLQRDAVFQQPVSLGSGCYFLGRETYSVEPTGVDPRASAFF